MPTTGSTPRDPANRPPEGGPGPTPSGQPDAQFWATVDFFEQILQTMPEDRVSLEVLSQAYEQSGDRQRAFAYLQRLAAIVLRDSDRDAAPGLQARLRTYAEQAESAALCERLAPLAAVAAPAAPAPAATAAAEVPSAAERRLADPAERRALVAQELDFAWLLHEQKLLSEEQYATVVSDLTDLSGASEPVPVSVLHLFQDRHFPNLDGALALAAEKSGLPLLPLSSFDPQPAAFGLLPRDYLVIKGVLPFEIMSQDLLVAVLNPMNETLRREIEALTGRRCHFYLANPADFDQALEKIRKQAPAAKPA